MSMTDVLLGDFLVRKVENGYIVIYGGRVYIVDGGIDEVAKQMHGILSVRAMVEATTSGIAPNLGRYLNVAAATTSVGNIKFTTP